MNVVVTGASSFVGINIIRKLLDNYLDIAIYGIVRPNSPNNQKLDEFRNRIKIIEIDMSDINLLTNYLEKIDVIYLNAWRGTRGSSRLDESIQKQSYIDSINAAKVAIELGANTIIGIGSQAEYGIVYDEVDENHETNPITAYGKYKLMTYNKLKEMCINNIDLKWGRIFSAYGVGDYENTLIMQCVNKMITSDTIELSKCTQMWNYINIIDVANIFSLMLKKCIPSGIYNISSNDTRVLKDYVLEIKKLTKSNSILNFGTVQKDEKLMNLLPINNKIMRLLKNYDFISFEEGINLIISCNEKYSKKGD